jgi:hypothetical protein
MDSRSTITSPIINDDRLYEVHAVRVDNCTTTINVEGQRYSSTMEQRNTTTSNGSGIITYVNTTIQRSNKVCASFVVILIGLCLLLLILKKSINKEESISPTYAPTPGIIFTPTY